MRYVCSVCGYVYDEAGQTPWAELPESWKCPWCGAAKADFAPAGGAAPAPAPEAAPETAPREISGGAEMRQLTALETGALCTSLAKGCEKQYLPEQAEAFRQLAAWFTAREGVPPEASFGALLERVNEDLASGFPAGEAAARQEGDRGALRSLTWSGKVTRILKALLDRYAREGDAMLADTGVWVCSICGFVYVGSELPEVCPVCKVPNRKFERIGGAGA